MDVPVARLSGITQIVLGDANVLYARVLRDYLLHAASTKIISITWSDALLDETIKHLIDNERCFLSCEAAETVGAVAARATRLKGIFSCLEYQPSATHFSSCRNYYGSTIMDSFRLESRYSFCTYRHCIISCSCSNHPQGLSELNGRQNGPSPCLTSMRRILDTRRLCTIT